MAPFPSRPVSQEEAVLAQDLVKPRAGIKLGYCEACAGLQAEAGKIEEPSELGVGGFPLKNDLLSAYYVPFAL